MDIFIDDRKLETDDTASVSITISVASFTDFEYARTGFTKTVYIPMTAVNREIMGDVDQPNGVGRFNSTARTARIEQDGFVLFEGMAQLSGTCRDRFGTGYYKICVVGPGRKWVTGASAIRFDAIDIPFEEKLTGKTIAQSWTWDKPVRFLPVERETLSPRNETSDIIRPTRILTAEDYHPFIRLRPLVESVFRSCGYRVESRFIESDFFGSLYMSGRYQAMGTSTLGDKMDFRAGRYASRTATANRLGRVYASPILAAASSVGNIVDTANPHETSGGISLGGVYTVNDCFQKIGELVAFVPTETVVVGFEYYLNYTSQYYMVSRDTLRGFDTVFLDEPTERKFTLLNRNTDRRTDIRTEKTYTIIIFNHQSGANYMLQYTETTATGATATRTAANFAARSYSVSFTSDHKVSFPRLYVYNATLGYYIEYARDWALYDGYVGETGTVNVEVTMRSAQETVMPSAPKYFNNIYFAGADEGMSFKINNSVTVRPYFTRYLPEGSSVSYKDIAAHPDTTALDMLRAVKQMFNLCFYTDEKARKVIIEPRDDFYTERPEVDLTDRIDYDREVVIEELGGDSAKTLVWCYGESGEKDGAVVALNRKKGERLGRWSAEVANVFAADGEYVYQNPLFTPSVNAAGNFPDAVTASLLQVGPQDGLRTDDDYNFPAKVVRYAGLVKLTGSQKWGWPSNDAQYPLLAFHYPGENFENGTGVEPDPGGEPSGDLNKTGFSLCFEDRDEKSGLHRFYDKSVAILDNGKRLTFYLKLYPEDVEPLISPDSLGRDLRCRYTVRLDGERVPLRLEQICDYNPASRSSTKCIFIKEE